MCFALCQFRHDTELARSILAKDEVNSQFSGDKPWERRTGGLIRQAGSVPSASGSASICRDDLHSAAREICPFPKDVSGGYSQLLGRIQTSPAGCGCTAVAVTVFRPEGSSGQNTAILRRLSGRDTQVTRNYCCRQMAASRCCRSQGRICDHQCSVACGRMKSSGSGTSNSSAATSARRCIAGSRSCQCSLSCCCSQWQFHHARHCYADLFGAVFRTDGPRALCQKLFRIFRLRWAWRTQRGGASASHQRRIVGSPHSGIVFC